MQLPSMSDGPLPKPTTPWLTEFTRKWKNASPAEQDKLKSGLIGKVSAVRDDWFELIEAAKIVEATRKQNERR
jgi:hypothetical protein